MAKKRGSGEGSIFQLPDGRWRAVVSLGFRNGNRWRKTYEASTMAQVQAKITEGKRDLAHGLNIAPERQTVGGFLSCWLASIKSDVRPATFVSYEGIVRRHLSPCLGKIVLSKLRAPHVQSFKKAKLDSDASSALVRYCLLVLRMALKEAYKLDLVRRNVAALVDYPIVQPKEIQPFFPEQARCFLAAVKGHRLESLFSVALALGLRKGEALGLQWGDVDLDNGALSIRRALQRIKMPGEKKGALRLTEPKRGSRRTVNLPAFAVAALHKHRGRQECDRLLAGSAWRDTGFVFTSTIGTPLEPRNVSTAFSRILEDAGLPYIRIHDLRHTCASLLLAQGVSMKAIQVILGHSDIRITMNLYAHLYPDAKREAAEKMDAILNPVARVVAMVGNAGKPN